jgi:hypothetical protein
MSIFASETAVTIPMQGDDGQTITIRALTGRELEEATFAHMTSMVGGHSHRGWSGAFKRIIAGVATPADAQQALNDPLGAYDRIVVVRAGLVSWSYPKLIAVPPETNGNAASVAGVVATNRQQAINDLLDDPLEFIAREIMRLTKPALFLATEDVEAAQKKLSGPAPAA